LGLIAIDLILSPVDNSTIFLTISFSLIIPLIQIKIAEQGSNAPIKAAPSRKVDELWHAHILSTKEYAQFCERHNNGNFIHHDPSIPDSPDRYRQTWIKYEEFFKSQPPPEIWPFPEVEEEDYSDEGGCWDPGCG